MKPNHTTMEFDGDLFSSLEEPEAAQPEARPYDKIIESRKNTSFAAEQIERQDEVQVVEKEQKKEAAVAEKETKTEYHIYPLDEVKAAAHIITPPCEEDGVESLLKKLLD